LNQNRIPETRNPSLLIFVLCLFTFIGYGCSGDNSNNSEESDTANAKPTASIVSPTNDQIYSHRQLITFTGIGNDPEDGNLQGDSLIWISSIDGQINTGTTFNKDDLSLGTHTITLSVTDSAGETGSHSIDIVVQANNLPIAEIIIPKNNRVYPDYYSVPFYGIAEDIEDGTLSGLSMRWESNIDGHGADSGEISGLLMPQSIGEHTITLTATDTAGAIGNDSVTVTVEKYPFSITDFHVSGNYVYFSDVNMGFGVIDVSNPSKPHVISTITISFEDLSVLSLIDHFVYLYDGVNLRVIDISDPSIPIIIRTIEIIPSQDYPEDEIKDIYISNTHTYLLCGRSLRIMSSSNAENPHIISMLDLERRGVGIFAQDNFVYLKGHGFDVIDVEDPYHPAIVASIESVLGWSPGDLYVVGDYAYTNWLEVIDISDPLNPTIGNSIRLDEDFVGSDVQVHGTNAYVVGLNGRMMVVDLIDPSGLKIIGSLNLSAYSKVIQIVGNYAYIGGPHSSRFKIVDISQPNNPKTIGNLGGFGRSVDIGFYDNYLFSACQDSGVQILDNSDPHHIINSGFIDTAIHTLALHISNSNIYTLDYLGLKIFDASVPLSPVLLGTVQTNWKPIDIYVSGNYAYVLSNSKFEVVEISNPQNPIIVGSNDQIGYISYSFNRFIVSGSYAYVPTCSYLPADDRCGYLIIDINEPTNPSVINFVDEEGVRGIDVVGTSAYLACTDNGFQVVNINDPHNSQIIGSISGLEIEPNWVKVSENHAYTISSDSFCSINVTDPQNPHIADSLIMPQSLTRLSIGYGSNLEIKGKVAYIGGPRITAIDISNPNNLRLIDALPAF